MLKKILVSIVIFLVLPLQVALADCSSLALKFSQNPNSLSMDELGSLGKCVNDKLREKMTGPGVPSSPSMGTTPKPVPPPPAPTPVPAPARIPEAPTKK